MTTKPKQLTTDDLDMAQVSQWLNDNQQPDPATFFAGSVVLSSNIAKGMVAVTYAVAQGLSDVITVKHGLSVLPSVVLLTPVGSYGAQSVSLSVIAATDTQFTFQQFVSVSTPTGVYGGANWLAVA